MHIPILIIQIITLMFLRKSLRTRLTGKCFRRNQFFIVYFKFLLIYVRLFIFFLDRFAQFFLSPLFDESSIAREVLAVGSEHDKNKKDDNWRYRQLNMTLARQGHDYSKFGTGTKQTLLEKPERVNELRDALANFLEERYSANLMTVAVLGQENLDELARIVIPTLAAFQNKVV